MKAVMVMTPASRKSFATSPSLRMFFSAVLGGKPQILVEAVADIISIQYESLAPSFV
jgi:hypothetical protein